MKRIGGKGSSLRPSANVLPALENREPSLQDGGIIAGLANARMFGTAPDWCRGGEYPSSASPSIERRAMSDQDQALRGA
jgi:hypothetical protein